MPEFHGEAHQLRYSKIRIVLKLSLRFMSTSSLFFEPDPENKTFRKNALGALEFANSKRNVRNLLLHSDHPYWPVIATPEAAVVSF